MNEIGRRVIVRTRFPAFHNWPNAPEFCAFLRHMHRHEFHVKLSKVVSHDDRDIEFITLKNQVDTFIDINYKGQFLIGKSCEMMAEELLREFNACAVEVSEDGENGAVVYPVQINSIVVDDPLDPPEEKPDPFKGAFIGYEAEGPFKGTATLFLPGDIGMDEYANAKLFLSQHGQYHKHLKNIYFGAKSKPVTHMTPLLIYLVSELERHTIDRLIVEVKDSRCIPSAMGQMYGFMLVANEKLNEKLDDIPEYCALPTYYKTIKEGIIYWRNDNHEYVTRIDDPIFKEDKDLLELEKEHTN